MSNDDSTFYRWITSSRFRDCSTCLSYSKARLYACAQRVIANHAERTIELLRYALGGNRPSQTDPLTRSHAGKPAMVRQPITQGWYFTIPSTAPDDAASKGPTYSTHD